jgi:hypothetical protein
MDTFNFPYHIEKTNYPAIENRMQFGNSYEAVSKPTAPYQRVFVLSFPGMMTYLDSGGAVDYSTNATINYETLRKFYEDHGLWDKFIYPHPKFGNVTVRFAQPLAAPDPVPMGNGAQGPFEIQFREQP